MELLVVLTLIALFATLAAPLLRNSLPAAEIKAEAEVLRSELRLLRGQAISQNRETWMLIDVADGRYAADDGRPHALPAGIRMDLLVGATEIVDEEKGRIRFYPDGTSTGGIVRLNRGGRAYEVRVDWFDGAVELGEADAG